MTTKSPPPAPSSGDIVIGRRRPEDREALERMYAEVFGREALERSRERWLWQYEKNPHCPPEGPEIWVAKEDGEILGQYASMPVRLKVKDRMLKASWGMDVMVKPDLQGKGVGSRLFKYWEDHVEAPLGLGLSLASYKLFQKLGWHDVGPVPCYSRPLDPKALLQRRVGRLAAGIIAPFVRAGLRIAYPVRKSSHPSGPAIDIQPLEGPFGEDFDQLWENASQGYDFVAERKSRYLEWKFHEVPYVTYEVYRAVRGVELVGYIVLRTAVKNDVKLGLIIDLFAHPEDHTAVEALIDWAAAWGRERGAGRLQMFTFNTEIADRLRYKGFLRLGSPMQFCLRIHSDHVDASFFQDTGRWHVTFGDSDMDRHL
jgi:GNAT superfamily N-acetyltransferase